MCWISSGSTLLNLVLTQDGDKAYRFGRIVSLCGLSSTGKTGLAIEACARAVKIFGKEHDIKVVYDETEAAFDMEYATKVGFPGDDVEMISSETVEEFFGNIMKYGEKLEEDQYLLYVLDSLDALPAAAEVDRKMTDGSYGTEKARQLSSLFRRIHSLLNQKNILLFIISQLRENVGVMFGDKYRRSGGMSLDYYASQIIRLTESGKVKDKGTDIGILVKAEIKKNKLGKPLRTTNFVWLFDFGLDDVSSCVLYGIENDLIEQKGGWLTYNDKKYRKDDLVDHFYENFDDWMDFRKAVIEHWLAKERAVEEKLSKRTKYLL